MRVGLSMHGVTALLISPLTPHVPHYNGPHPCMHGLHCFLPFLAKLIPVPQVGEVAGCILQWMVHNGTRVFGSEASSKTLALLSEPVMVDALMQVSASGRGQIRGQIMLCVGG